MPFCGKCGAKIPDGNKFCTECGAELITVENNENNKTVDKSEYVERPVPKSKQPKNNQKKRSIPWMIVSISALALAIYGWFVESPVATIIVSLVGLILGIISLIKHAKFRAIAILAIILSALMLVLWGLQGAMDATSGSKTKKLKTNRFHFMK